VTAIIKAIKNLWLIILRWRAGPPPLLVIEPPSLPAEEPPVLKRTRTPRKPHQENFGVLSSLDGLLDGLDEYFRYIRLYKKCDPDGYALFSKIGGRIIGESSLFAIDDDPIFMRGDLLPSFGMVALTRDRADYTLSTGDKVVHPKLVSFRKQKPGPDVERYSDPGETFAMTMVYVGRDLKRPYVLTFFIHVSKANGDVTLLRERKCVSIKLESHRKKMVKHQKQREASSLRISQFKLPDEIFESFLQVNAINKLEGRPELTSVHQFVVTLFRSCLSAALWGNSGFRINCRKGPLMGVFNIEAERSPYFFRARDKQVTESGRTKPIFHAVRPHHRELADGQDIIVKLHYRGLRKFDWNGFSINITVPGRHHLDLDTFTASAIELGPWLPQWPRHNKAVLEPRSGGHPPPRKSSWRPARTRVSTAKR
jgi:hypothetical protein